MTDAQRSNEVKNAEFAKNVLPQNVRDKIDHWLLRYPEDQQRSGVMEALRLAQEENSGFLTEALMDGVADYLNIPRMQVYEVATFYTMYNLNPIGRHLIQVCTNISCMLNGSERITNHLKNRLNINFNQTTDDGQFTLKEVECLGACINAPVLQLNKNYYESLTEERIDQILSECRHARDKHHGE